MELINFYKRVLETLGLKVTEDNFVTIPKADKDVPLKENSTPIVLPTKEHVETLLDKDETGNIVPVKFLYNPIDETVLKGDSVSLKKTKIAAVNTLTGSLGGTARLLLEVASNDKLQTRTPMVVNDFLKRLSEAKNPGIKKIVDDATLEKWEKIFTSSFEPGMTRLIKVFVKKGGVLDGIKYNRTATFKFPVYEELVTMEKDNKLNGVTLRNKDITVFKILFEYLVPELDSSAKVAYGSNDTTAPGFVSLFKLYLKIMTHIQQVLKALEGVYKEWEALAFVSIAVNEAELSELSVFARELLKIPSELDITRKKMVNAAPTPPLTQNTANTVPGDSVQVEQSTEYEDPSTAAIRKALYGSGVPGIAQPVNVQNQQVLPQAVLANNMQPQTPMGINNQNMFAQQMPMGMPNPVNTMMAPYPGTVNQFGQPIQQAQPMGLATGMFNR